MKYPCLILGLLSLGMGSGLWGCAQPSAEVTEVPPPPPVSTPVQPTASLPPLCQESEPLIAFAQTENVDVAFCGSPQGEAVPRVYRSRNRSGSPGVELTLNQEALIRPGEFEAIAQTKEGATRYRLISPDVAETGNGQLVVTLPDGSVFTEKVTRFVAPIDYVRRNYEKFRICQSDGGFEPDLENNQHQAYDLGQSRYLVLIVCRLAAYQAVTEWVIYEATSPQPRVLPVTYEDFDQEKVIPALNRVMTGYPSFDPKTQVVTNFQKFRGPGDCGIFTRHVLEGQKLVLREFRRRECDTTEAFTEPEQFPLLFPSPTKQEQ